MSKEPTTVWGKLSWLLSRTIPIVVAVGVLLIVWERL